MTRRLLVACSSFTFVAAIALLIPIQVDAQRETRERSIPVSVVSGSDDAPVTGLTAADFTVREDGLAREVLRVGPAPLPSHLLLLVDDSQVTQPAITYLRTGLTSFVRKMAEAAQGVPAEAAPQWGLMTFGDRPTKRVDYNQSEIPILRAVDRLFHQTGAGSTLIEGLLEASKELKKREAARPMIVAFVDEAGPEFSNRIHKDVAAALEGANASLWVLALQTGAQNVTSTESRERAIVTGDVVKWSGGGTKVVLTPQSLDSGFTSLANQILARYNVTYGRPESLVPPSKIEVEVKKREARVRAARWFGR
jgi:VWA domain-containing protein